MSLLYVLLQKRERKAEKYRQAVEQLAGATETERFAKEIVVDVLHEELARLDKKIEESKLGMY